MKNSHFDAIDVHLVWKKIQLIKHIMVVNYKPNSLNVLTAFFSREYVLKTFPKMFISDTWKTILKYTKSKVSKFVYLA